MKTSQRRRNEEFGKNIKLDVASTSQSTHDWSRGMERRVADILKDPRMNNRLSQVFDGMQYLNRLADFVSYLTRHFVRSSDSYFTLDTEFWNIFNGLSIF
jgi:cob(I)alamin adenosyltransferase